jgi:hypothetical protein
MYKLTGLYLAAHWFEPLEHHCTCRRVHQIRAGVIKRGVKKRVKKDA